MVSIVLNTYSVMTSWPPLPTGQYAVGWRYVLLLFISQRWGEKQLIWFKV